LTRRRQATRDDGERALPLLGLRSPPADRVAASSIPARTTGRSSRRGHQLPRGPPFLTPWKTEPPQDLPRFFAQYYWQLRASSPPAGGRPAGVLWMASPSACRSSSATSTCESHHRDRSWLPAVPGPASAPHTPGHRRLRLRPLDARHVTSATFSDNVASVSVSRKVATRERSGHLGRGGGPSRPALLLSRGNLVPTSTR